MINKKKDLHSGMPLWTSYGVPEIPFEKLKSDTVAEVVVIGAGITGAMAAEDLSAAGFKVIVLDRRAPLSGATAATTALLQYEIDKPLITLQKQIGSEKALRAWRRSKLGLESLAGKIQGLNIECDFLRRESLYLSGNLLTTKMLKEEADTRNLIGIHTQFVSSSELAAKYAIKHNGALLSFDNIAVDPLRLAAGFLLKAVENGAKIYSPVIVNDVMAGDNGISLTTEGGVVIRCKYLVFATGYEIPQYMKQRRHSVHSTWVIATKKQKDKLWPGECFIWEAAEPYLYIRTTPDGRVICGGEDEDFVNEDNRDKLLPAKTAVLEKKLSKLFPNIDCTPEYRWTGSFGASLTGLPTIGEVPEMKNCFGIMAFGGNGITFSRIAAEMVKAKFTGKTDVDADLFAF